MAVPLGTRPGALDQIAYYCVGELGAGRCAIHVPGPDALFDGAAQGSVDAQSHVRHAHVLQHPDSRPDNARRISHGQSAADHVVQFLSSGERVAVLVIVYAARAVVAHRAEHDRAGPVSGGRYRGRAAGQHAARSAGQRPVQAGREQHIVTARVFDHPQAELVQLLLAIVHVRIVGTDVLTGPQESSVRQPHHVGLVQHRDAMMAVRQRVFESKPGHRFGPLSRHRLDGLHNVCAHTSKHVIKEASKARLCLRHVPPKRLSQATLLVSRTRRVWGVTFVWGPFISLPPFYPPARTKIISYTFNKNTVHNGVSFRFLNPRRNRHPATLLE